MELLVLTFLLVSLAVGGLRWGVDSREPRNNWDGR
jgi:hypothetical protein